MKKLCIALVVLVAISLLLFNESSEVSFETEVDVASTVHKGDRVLGVAITEGDIGFEQSFEAVNVLGSEFVSLPLQWDEFETAPGVYDTELLEIFSTFYTAEGKTMLLELNPIDTTHIRIPEYLNTNDFSDPRVIQAFTDAISVIRSTVPDAIFDYIAIGNEIDGVLVEGQVWQQYSQFLTAVLPIVREQFPEAKIGSKIMFSSLMTEEAQTLNDKLDVIMTTHYMLDDTSVDQFVRQPSEVRDDFAKVVSTYPNTEIAFIELGYPSSTYLDSSEELQAEFISEAFAAWDAQSDSIKIINFVALHDFSSSEMSLYEKYYDNDDLGFLEFLSTLGFRTAAGVAKESYDTIGAHAQVRGW